jgi:hypothetical protein
MKSKEVAKKSEVTVVAAGAVQGKILVIRGDQVMLDEDLAGLYGVETKALTRAVRRNKDRFPDDFMFQLSKEEFAALRRQSGTSNEGRGGRRYAPYAFTEQGVAMLSSVLQSKLADHERHLVAIFKVLKQLAAPPPKKKHPIGFAAALPDEK